MESTVAGIYVWRSKAYLPVQAQFESGIFTGVEPVYITNLETEELVSAIQEVRKAGHPRLADPAPEEWRKRKDPVLRATKARTWKELARAGASYAIGWTDQEIRVDMSRLDEKGRWEIDPQKTRLFPPDTPLENIVAVILEDIRTRPELWE